MSEYWVSQAKFYCKVCNCYIADNKPSRQHHENGVKHKQKVEEMQKQKRMDKLHGARSEAELKQQLAEIEKDAKEAIASDRSQHDGLFYQNSSVRSRAPPPPAPRPPGFPQPFKQTDENLEQEEDEGNGIYTVKGQTYLQGKVHEQQIRSGMTAEIFVESLDEWFSGTISARVETAVPHTSLVLVSFDVEYAVPRQQEGGSGEATQTVVEKGIKSDRIRLLAQADGTLPGDNQGAAATGHHTAAVLCENTGIGMWQTVAVREVDEVAELEESDRHRESMLGRRPDPAEEAETLQRKKQARAAAAEEGDDSALSAFDPYGRHKNVYKGIRIHEEIDRKELIESVAQGAIVGFKKRKTAGGAEGGVKSESQSAPQVVQAEAKDELHTEAPAVADNPVAPATVPGVPETAAVPVPVGPVSMKITNAGGKRKFRQRAPSPP